MLTARASTDPPELADAREGETKMGERDGVDTLSADVTMTLTWRDWGLVRMALIAAEEHEDRFTTTERARFLDLAEQINREMNESPAFAVWYAEQWTKADTERGAW